MDSQITEIPILVIITRLLILLDLELKYICLSSLVYCVYRGITWLSRLLFFLFSGQLPLEGFTSHPNALPYFLHWMSLTALESLEEVKLAVVASHGALPRDRVTAQATPCSEHELTFSLVITGGSPLFRPADGVALSRADISEREYIGEITAVDGVILTVNIVWPTNSDDSSRKNILEGKWYLHKFPSLVGYRRITTALKALQNVKSCGRDLFEGIVGSFCFSDPSGPGKLTRIAGIALGEGSGIVARVLILHRCLSSVQVCCHIMGCVCC